VFRELRHEIAAYEDFRAYRKSLPKRGNPAALAAQIGKRRTRLMARMRRRRAEEGRRRS